MTSERSGAALRAARRSRSSCAGALLAAASFAALAGCSVPEAATHTQPEVAASTVAALDDGPAWPHSSTIPRAYHAGVELGGGRALVCGGKDDTNVFPANCELLEAQGSTLKSTVYPLPGARTGDPAQGRIEATLTLLPTGGVLIAGGRPSWDARELGARASRPIADWQQAGDASSNWLSPEVTNVPRAQHTATLLGTNVAIFGGFNSDDTARTAQIEIRSQGGTDASWTVFGKEAPRVGHSATLLKPNGSGARVLIFGGVDQASGAALQSGFIFPVEGGIKYISPLPGRARLAHTATLLDDANGSVLVVGGETPPPQPNTEHLKTQYLGDAWRYDPVNDHWTEAGKTSPTALAPRSYHSAASLGSFVIVAGGEAPDPVSTSGQVSALHSVQSYDWRHDAWSNLRPLSADRAYFQLLELSETQLVASGGWARNGTTTAASSDLIELSALGGMSSDATSCASGHQADGVCCESDCNGPCQACDADGAAGSCQPVTGAPHSGHPSCPGNLLCANGACPAACDSTTPCAAGFFCDGGKCAAQGAFGAKCDAGAACANGAPCVDGVCCKSACSGACEACSLGTGICRVLDKGQKPLASHPACGGDAQCAGRCDGRHGDRCSFPGPESTCSAASCEDQQSVRTASTCDGQGACRASAVVDQCGPYACEATAVGGAQCLKSCARREDCSREAHCDESGDCVRCDDSDCDGFRCDRKADECKRSCQKSETDCQGGYYCHPLEHRCIASITFPASALPACTMGVSRRGYHSIAIAAAAWLLLSARRRRFKRTAGGLE